MLKKQRFNQKGATLLEVLVTVAVLSVGLLGVAGLLMKSTSLGISAHDRTISTQKIYAFADRMRLNPQGVNDGNYNDLSGAPSDPNCLATGCTPAQIAALDFFQWSQELAGSMAGGGGSVARNGNLFLVTVNWQGKGLDLLATVNQTYSLSVRP
ncbi:MAG: type IV pilus modification protein PilV [Burkholderiales bacterium]|jgi:type IV pilus assembly protein PilV|nr:type IV pilus modification protein PilV [Burkholderiales bacterium]